MYVYVYFKQEFFAKGIILKPSLVTLQPMSIYINKYIQFTSYYKLFFIWLSPKSLDRTWTFLIYVPVHTTAWAVCQKYIYTFLDREPFNILKFIYNLYPHVFIFRILSVSPVYVLSPRLLIVIIPLSLPFCHFKWKGVPFVGFVTLHNCYFVWKKRQNKILMMCRLA